MSAFFTLAADFVERMTNPAYGIRVNEDYSLQFATLLNGEEVDAILKRECEQLKNGDTLTPHGWLWLLTWARSHEVRLNDTLLLDLASKWSSVFMQVPVIDVATIHSEGLGGPALPIEAIDQPFLRKLLHEVTRTPVADQVEGAEIRADEIRTKHAENTLVALLQINRDVTLDAASALLYHHWAGQPRLLEFYKFLREGLEAEVRAVWDERLGTPFQA